MIILHFIVLPFIGDNAGHVLGAPTLEWPVTLDIVEANDEKANGHKWEFFFLLHLFVMGDIQPRGSKVFAIV